MSGKTSLAKSHSNSKLACNCSFQIIRGNRTLQDWSSGYGSNDTTWIYFCTCSNIHIHACLFWPQSIHLNLNYDFFHCQWTVYCVLAAMPPKKAVKSQGTFGNALISSDLPNFISAEVLGWHHNHDILPCKFVTLSTIPTAKQRVAVPAVQLKSSDPLAPINKVCMNMDLCGGCLNQDEQQ